MIPDVVHHIVHVEQIGDRCALIRCYCVRGGVGKIKVELGRSIRTETGLIIVVLVFVGVHIVSAGDGVFSTALSVVVMPAIGRGKAVTWIYDHTAVAMTRAFHRKRKNIVLSGQNRQQLLLSRSCNFLLMTLAEMACVAKVAKEYEILLIEKLARLCTRPQHPPMFGSVGLNGCFPNELEPVSSVPIFEHYGNAFIEHIRIAPLPAEIPQGDEFR